jgi:ribonucleoside-triphosphate reductase
MLMSETDMGEDHARKLAGEVIMKTHRMELEHAPASLIKELVKARLFEHGFERINEQCKRRDVPIYDVRGTADL